MIEGIKKLKGGRIVGACETTDFTTIYIRADSGIYGLDIENGTVRVLALDEFKEPKLICIQKCPELEGENLKHCTDTRSGIERREERYSDYCPCGNTPIWEPISADKVR